MMFRLISIFAFISLFSVSAQEIAIGAWRNHLPYNKSVAVADAGNKIYCATELALFSYDKAGSFTIKYSKVNGLSDIFVSTIEFDPINKILILVYTNSNIDLIKENEIVNISDLKRATITGDKRIYHVYIKDNFAYLSCGFGIVVLDLLKNEIKDTYRIGSGGSDVKVNAVCCDTSKIFAATDLGIFVASLNNPNLSNFNFWKLQDSAVFLPEKKSNAVAYFGGKIYADVADSIFYYDAPRWRSFHIDTSWHNKYFTVSSNNLVITQDSFFSNPFPNRRFLLMDASNNFTYINSVWLPAAGECKQDAEGTLWFPDGWYSLGKYKDEQLNYVQPNGPLSYKVSEMAFYKNELWVAPGQVTRGWHYQYNGDGFFSFIGNEWKSYNQYQYPILKDSIILDLISVAINSGNGNPYFGSFGSVGGGGVIEYDRQATVVHLYKSNTTLQGEPFDNNSYRISGLAFDKENNLWVSNYEASAPLSVRKNNGEWKAFSLPAEIKEFSDLTQILIDQNNQKWIVLEDDPTGILVFNHGADIDNASDDKFKRLTTGTGNGNLPNAVIRCIAEDLSGEIWVGTEKGIYVFYCAAEIFSQQGCDAQQILFKQDNYYGYLLENEVVNCIAVDGADRKWIGTNNGVFLMSDDGTQQVLYFNENNSPLFANTVNNIAINPETGEVYFGTSAGIISYKSDATAGKEKHDNVYVYPNPVRQNYEGTIAIKGLVQNAYIKITDISGTLVYQTKALGGQVVWNGKNYKGEKPKTGVYLVFSSNEDGSETIVTKLLFIN